jgi:protein SCO1/2
MSVGTQLDGAIASNILKLPLVDSTGKPTSLAAFHGKVLVINDTMTLCQETCPLDTANLVATARAVEKAGLGDKVEFLSITFDPQRDTVPQLAAYRALYAPAPADWALLTGDATTIAALWKYLGVYYQRVPEGTPPAKNWRTGQTLTYDLNHADEVFFADPSGNERFLLDGAAYVKPGTTVPKTLYEFLSADGHQHLTNPEDGSWTVAQALSVVSWLSATRIAGTTG